MVGVVTHKVHFLHCYAYSKLMFTAARIRIVSSRMVFSVLWKMLKRFYI